jgi:hypothetical protein
MNVKTFKILKEYSTQKFEALSRNNFLDYAETIILSSYNSEFP